MVGLIQTICRRHHTCPNFEVVFDSHLGNEPETPPQNYVGGRLAREITSVFGSMETLEGPWKETGPTAKAG